MVSSSLSRCLPLLLMFSSTAEAGMPYLRQADLNKMLDQQSSSSSDNAKANNKKAHHDWVSLSENVEFMASNDANIPHHSRILEDSSVTGAWEEYNPYSIQPFVEGMSEYDEYQQAWRLLGFMIDCNDITDDDASGSGSGDVTEDGCARYVLWAAYVDLNYQGGGIGEYQYWDKDTESWDKTACNYADGSGDSRCAKMDCHLEDTKFSILGFFKHRNYDDWMEQLFKHEGMCVWTEEEYAFMKNARKAWPNGCIATGTTTADGEYYLYYNIKPLQNGRISLGLYTDTQCLDDYPVSTDVLENTIGNVFADGGGSGSGDNGDYDFSDESLSESLNRWHSAFDVWHTCHPCVAYDLNNTDGSAYLDDDGRRRLGGEYAAEGDLFECYDDAGYTNVNQCMKFSAKTVMRTATFRDLSLGRTQTTLVEYPLSGFFTDSSHYHPQFMANFTTYFCLSLVSLALLYAIYNFARVWKAKREGEQDNKSQKEEFLDKEEQEK